MRRFSLLLALILMVGSSVIALAEVGVELRLTRLEDTAPGNATRPVRLLVVPSTDASCAAADACDTRSTFVIQIAPCPPNAAECMGSFALYDEITDQAESFAPLDLELLPDLPYAIFGEWQVQRWSMSTSCDQLFCDESVPFQTTFRASDLVNTRVESWSVVKGQYR